VSAQYEKAALKYTESTHLVWRPFPSPLVDHLKQSAKSAKVDVSVVHILRLAFAERIDDVERLTLIVVLYYVAVLHRGFTSSRRFFEALYVYLELGEDELGDSVRHCVSVDSFVLIVAGLADVPN